MTTVGVTGHRFLPDPARWAWVRTEIDAALDTVAPPVVGVSGLAEGADQCFAEAVLARDGRLHAVIAFEGFRDTLEGDEYRTAFDDLVARADPVDVIEPRATRELAYLEVGHRVVDLADVMVAVWDGQGARGTGGTAEVVEYARAAGTPVFHVDTTEQTARWL